MQVKRMTPVLLASAIEPSVEFWTRRLGFEKTVEVPGESGAVFAALVKDGVEVMIQTIASVQQDADGGRTMGPAAGRGPTYLYIEVDDLNALLQACADLPKAMAERTAFYGMREFAVQDPGGHFITFAQKI